jgi:Flp pilus assembly protein TadD
VIPWPRSKGFRWEYEELERLGERTTGPYLASELARTLYLQGRLDEAYHYTQIAETYGLPSEAWVAVGWRGVRGSILARRGETSAGTSLAREAVALAGATDMLWYHGRALEDLAEVLEVSGRSNEARVRFGEAIHLYDRKGIKVLADRARRRQVAISS